MEARFPCSRSPSDPSCNERAQTLLASLYQAAVAAMPSEKGVTEHPKAPNYFKESKTQGESYS